jgi:hypothetical protein
MLSISLSKARSRHRIAQRQNSCGVEFMIELGDASIAELLMRRFQLLERLQ